ncbi:MAG: sulfotransferase [Pseudomonadota bacterium]
MPTTKKPTFFILGAPKCGTTSFAAYLDQHPEITISTPKEPNFFSTDFPKLMATKSLDEYLGFFNFPENDTAVIGGEASTWYLYSQVAATNILEFAPDAKMIVMLRNPVDMFFSLHAQFQYNLIETIDDPEAAWNAAAARPATSIRHYEQACSLGMQVSRLLQTVDRDNVHFVLFHDLAQDPEREYLKALEFLGKSFHGPISYEIVNERKTHKSRSAEKMLRKTPSFVDNALRVVKKTLGIKRLGLSDFLLNLNRSKVKKQPQDPAFRQRLAKVFHDDIVLLEEQLGVSLEQWRQ